MRQKAFEHSCKIVVVDPVLLTHQDVIEIFSFFFAGNETVLIKDETDMSLSAAVQRTSRRSRLCQHSKKFSTGTRHPNRRN